MTMFEELKKIAEEEFGVKIKPSGKPITFEQLFGLPICKHEFVSVSNFYGDYINYVSTGFPVYRSRQKCIHCGKERLSEYLDENCKVVNDGKCEI